MVPENQGPDPISVWVAIAKFRKRGGCTTSQFCRRLIVVDGQLSDPMQCLRPIDPTDFSNQPLAFQKYTTRWKQFDLVWSCLISFSEDPNVSKNDWQRVSCQRAAYGFSLCALKKEFRDPDEAKTAGELAVMKGSANRGQKDVPGCELIRFIPCYSTMSRNPQASKCSFSLWSSKWFRVVILPDEMDIIQIYLGIKII